MSFYSETMYFFSVDDDLKFTKGLFSNKCKNMLYFIGKLELDDLKIFGILNTTVKIYFTTKAIPSFYLDILKESSKAEINQGNQYTFQFIVNLRKCILGEIYKNETKSLIFLFIFIIYLLYLIKRCYKCPENKYSLNLDDTDCKICPESAKCEGGSSIIILPGLYIFIYIYI